MDFKETCLWMSYRYAIGRKSIAAVSHAAEIAKHLDWIPDDRWEFTAEDILREVNQSIGWTDNLTVMGLDGYRETDVFSVLFSFIEKNPTYMSHDMFNKHHWVINLDNGNVSVMEKEEPTNNILTIFYDYDDYKDWIKLAKTAGARNKIKQWFKKECREENIQRGREMLGSELRREGLTLGSAGFPGLIDGQRPAQAKADDH